jgi:hypothetical protein
MFLWFSRPSQTCQPDNFISGLFVKRMIFARLIAFRIFNWPMFLTFVALTENLTAAHFPLYLDSTDCKKLNRLKIYETE